MISAARDAANKNDFAAFDKADAAQRTGRPLAAVDVAPPDTKGVAPPAGADAPAKEPAPAPKGPSAKDREADDRLRSRVAEAVEPLHRTIADLERRLSEATTGRREPEPPAAPAKPEPAYKRYLALPHAPKLADFDSVEEHAAAMAVFIDDTRTAERAAADRDRTTQTDRDRILRERSTQFGTRMREAATKDPDLATKIPRDLLDAVPLSGLSAAELQAGKATFANVIAEAAFRSEDPAGLLVFLHAHADERARIVQLPQSEWLYALAALDGRLRGQPAAPSASPAEEKPAADAPSTITAAPPPPTTLSRAGSPTDPQAAAFARGDFASWDRIEQEKVRAKRTAAA